MIIHKKLSLPYHVYSIIHQKLLSQIFRITQGVCTHQIPLQYSIHHVSAEAVSNLLRSIQKLLKKVLFLSRKTITNRRWLLLMRHALQLQLLISIFLKVYLSIYLRNLGSRRCLIWQELCKMLSNSQQKAYI